MVHWKSYLASFFLVLTIGLLWLFAATGPTQQKADAGILRAHAGEPAGPP